MLLESRRSFGQLDQRFVQSQSAHSMVAGAGNHKVSVDSHRVDVSGVDCHLFHQGQTVVGSKSVEGDVLGVGDHHSLGVYQLQETHCLDLAVDLWNDEGAQDLETALFSESVDSNEV